MKNIKDVPTFNFLSGMKESSRKEELAHEHPAHLHEYIFDQPVPKFQWEMYDDFLQGYIDPSSKFNPILELAPRNHGKTTVAEGYSLWRIGKNINIQIQIITATEDLSLDRVDKIGKVIEFNEKYIGLFGKLCTREYDEFKWTAHKKDVIRPIEGNVMRGSTLVGFSIEGQSEGTRADLQIYDDIVSERNSQTSENRNRVRSKYRTSFLPILQPNGQQIFLGTRFHYSDLYGELIEIFDQEERRYTHLWQNEQKEQLLLKGIQKEEIIPPAFAID